MISPHSQVRNEIRERRSALSGTRAMIANEQFAALAGLMVEAGMCSGERVRQMIEGVSTKIALPNCEWRTDATEVRAHQRWLEQIAKKLERV